MTYVLNKWNTYVLTIYFSTNNIANPLNFSWYIVDLRYHFIEFNFERLLSTEATVTYIVSKILQTMHVFGHDRGYSTFFKYASMNDIFVVHCSC